MGTHQHGSRDGADQHQHQHQHKNKHMYISDAASVLSEENAQANNKYSNAAYVARTRGTRKLVLCFDGTGNKFHGDDSDSNILKVFRMLDRTADDQYHYYQRESCPPTLHSLLL